MTHSTVDNKYDFEIKDKEFRPNKQNPEKIIFKVETAVKVDGEEQVFSTNKVFQPRQVSSGRWKQHIKLWIDEQIQNCKCSQSDYNVETGKHSIE